MKYCKQFYFGKKVRINKKQYNPYDFKPEGLVAGYVITIKADYFNA